MQKFEKHLISISLSAAFTLISALPAYAEDDSDVYNLAATRNMETISVTARKTNEAENTVPIAVSVFDDEVLREKGIFNVSRVAEFTPSLQFYSSNPRNTAINIRGLGSPFGLTNDGIEQGVGMYVDGVYFARPALATLDFVDVQQIEVLRGPQGTLFGKNTTAGAINIRTQQPEFTPNASTEISLGNLGYTQVRGSVTGPIWNDKLAARVSFSSTNRDGVLYNVRTEDDLNDLDNLTLRSQFLYEGGETTTLFSADYTRQRPEGYAQVYARTAPTLRPENRQLETIIQDLNYQLPSKNPFDRLTDTDTPHRSYQDIGGAALTITTPVWGGELTSITAYRFWDWDPSSDRDYLGLPVTTVSANPSRQTQWTQELTYQGSLTPSLDVVSGLFLFNQTIDSTGKQQQGAAASRFLLNPTAAGADNPALLDGLTQLSDIQSDFSSFALYTQFIWEITDALTFNPGVRFNYDRKSVDFNRVVTGGLETNDPALIATQRSILRPQQYGASNSDSNISVNLTLDAKLSDTWNSYVTYATAFKSIGLNLSGVPNNADGQLALEAATVAPEDVRHWELGFKYASGNGLNLNIAAFDTLIENYQANVVNAQLGVLRGFLANAERVSVSGVETDFRAEFGSGLSLNASVAYTDARYDRFVDAPPPIELTGGVRVFDASGTRLPGISKWASTATLTKVWSGQLFNSYGEWFISTDVQYRSDFSSSPTFSEFMVVDAYTLVNAQAGFKSDNQWNAFIWARNLADTNYFQLLSAVSGGSGMIAGLPGDPRTFGVTLSYHW
ncbi:TonB-dependent receptor [Aliiglaciecola aliphaticivorans]